MMMFDEMGFCGDLDFFSASLKEGDVNPPQSEPEPVVEDDYSDEEIDVDELERRMWRDKMRLKRLKEMNRGKEGVDSAKQRQSQEQARRKKMSRPSVLNNGHFVTKRPIHNGKSNRRYRY